VNRMSSEDCAASSGTLWRLEAAGVIQLGLLLLIATPVVRVAFSIFGFAKERDNAYAVFTLIEFSVLLYSLLGSI